MRDIKICIPSGKVKMTLFKNTDDEEDFEIRSLKRGIPYVFAYGVKYYLSNEEIEVVKKALNII